MSKSQKNQVWTIPNLLSIARILLIPVYIYIYRHASKPSHYYAAGAILTLSCITDWFDGWIARRFQMTSTLGRILDPIADKGTQLSLLITIGMSKPSLRYLLYLFLVKESFQAIAGLLMLKKGKILTGALPIGKISTTALFVGLILLVIFPGLSRAITAAITLTCGFLLLIAFWEYAMVYLLGKGCFENISKSNGSL